jgi:hypothetical protein
VELGSAGYHNPQRHWLNVLCPGKQLKDRLNVLLSLTFVQRVDYDDTRQGLRRSLLYF